MTFGDDTIIRRFSDAVQRRGQQITLRRATSAGALGPNPPAVIAPVLAGNVSAGASQISIRATAAFGRILPGDTITIGTLPEITVAAVAFANAAPVDPSAPWVPGFTNIELAGTLASAASDGTAIQIIWSADALVWCVIGALDFSLRSDQIIAGDETVVIPSYGVARPSVTDQLIIGDQTRTIISVTPARQRGLIVSWQLHAR